MATKAKTTVKLKPIVNRKEEKKTLNSTVKKIPPVGSKDQQQPKTIIPKSTEFNRLIHGNFTEDFSKQTSRSFRIFLSSTFSDFKIERNELYRRVFPIIKQKCAQLGYEFQVVDMRWGVSDTADTDHTADILCMDEIERCIDQSAGLNFIYLIGNRYGYMYVPLEIDEEEFHSILEIAQEEKIENINLIRKWFQLDQNSLPPKYVYVPITTYFKHFEQPSIEQEQEKVQWRIEEKSLLKALRDSVDKAFERNKLTNQQAIKYFQSITEREIRRGTIEQNRSNVIGIIRDFTDSYVETAIDAKFFDSSKNERITKSIDQLKAYCEKITPAKQLKKFLVPWKSGGLNLVDNESHRIYIDEFCQYLISTILELIEKTYRKMSHRKLSPFHEDLLHHAVFCREKTKCFFGREELLANIHSRIESNRRTTSTPIALVAESGSGKTSFMARLAKELRIWYPTSAIFIRFLGTSAMSTNIELVIRSLCRQIKLVYGGTDNNEIEDEDDSSLTFSSLVRMFHERLKTITKKARSKSLFILLDALDQFEITSKYSFQFDSWLLHYLPRDVHIILSFLPTIENINFKDLFLQFIRNDETCLFSMPRLRPKDCEDIIRSSLQTFNRQLTSEQYTYLLTTVEQNPKPLYLKLLIDITRRWTSYADSTLKMTLFLPETIDNAIEQLFSRLENRHGKEFVQYSLAYLVYGYNGISETELEDCLSINDIVLNEIYTHHDPPIPHAIHVPSLLCQSFLYSIQDYLSRKRIDEKHILAFYHRKFIELTRKSYEFLRKQSHEHLIEIYSHDQLTYQRTIQLKKRNNQIIENADRLITTQLTNNFNKRKLLALPYHCLEYGHEKDHLLRSSCLFNLTFLSCQLQSLGHTNFLDSIRYCLRLRSQWMDLKRLYRAVWSIDDQSIENTDFSLIIAEQILGFIDIEQINSLYKSNESMKNLLDFEKFLLECQIYCQQHENSFRSLYAGFPQETGALAWSFSPVTHVLYTNEFYTIVILDGSQDKDEYHFIQAYTVAIINLQTGKVDKIYLDDKFDQIWNGYVTKDGNKLYVFGKESVQIFNTRTGDMINERSLSWDNKSFCNKDFCITNNEEQLIVANEWRLIAMDEKNQENILRSGRIPIRHPLFSIENSKDVIVKLRCIGTNDEYVLCLIFDEYYHCLLTLWSLNEHLEMLPMHFAYLYLEITSPYLFDFSLNNNNEILYLATTQGNLRILHLLQMKSNTKIANLPIDELTMKQICLKSKNEFDCLVCLTNDILVLSTSQELYLYNRNDLSTYLKKLIFNENLWDWKIINHDDDQQRILITIDTSGLFLTLYRQDHDWKTNFHQTKVEFRSNIYFLKFIQTITIMDNDEKKKTYVLILLSDQTIQLLDTNQISQASLQPNGLFTRIKNYHISENSIIACEYDSKCPLILSISNNNQSQLPRYLHLFEQIHIENIGLFDNDQYYILITKDLLISIYSIHDLSQKLFESNLITKLPSKFVTFQIYPLNMIIFMFNNQWIFWKLKFQRLENLFEIETEQSFLIPDREVEYSIELLPNQQFFILKQSLKLEHDLTLNDFRIYNLNKNFQISSIKESITHMKSKLATTGKIIGFRTYTSLYTRSELYLAHQGLILNVRLPSNIAELIIRSDYHCWLRHSLALYQQTTEKSSLSAIITSLAVYPTDDSCLVSGADDGSIIIWYLNGKCRHDILESMHTDEISGLIFDSIGHRLFSSSIDHTIAIWSETKLLHSIQIHLPPERINLFSSLNILLVQGQFWGFKRLLMFDIGKDSQSLVSIEKANMKTELKNTISIQASDVAGWGL